MTFFCSSDQILGWMGLYANYLRLIVSVICRQKAHSGRYPTSNLENLPWSIRKYKCVEKVCLYWAKTNFSIRSRSSVMNVSFCDIFHNRSGATPTHKLKL